MYKHRKSNTIGGVTRLQFSENFLEIGNKSTGARLHEKDENIDSPVAPYINVHGHKFFSNDEEKFLATERGRAGNCSFTGIEDNLGVTVYKNSECYRKYFKRATKLLNRKRKIYSLERVTDPVTGRFVAGINSSSALGI